MSNLFFLYNNRLYLSALSTSRNKLYINSPIVFHIWPQIRASGQLLKPCAKGETVYLVEARRDEKEPDKNGSSRSFHLSRPLLGEAVESSCKFYEPTKCTRLALRSNKRQLIHAGPNAFPERLSSKTHPCRYFGITNFTPSPFLPATRLSRSRSTYPSTRLTIDGTFHSGYREKSTTMIVSKVIGFVISTLFRDNSCF